ncbi:MAG TPA: flagellar basal body rod protein FlgF [Povalibacter sp.]|uniref:flagellar basal body rod protein FlgF n=1 Tax=Povalibacter sp. TaxID=1962978 RepID=UPI002C10E312|nr:flagellar basal body rod protein FlgF [Povalibacter sp.]HMN43135.1 flagellar basal body rod protein FlgF [Povalibacter sp.]
MDALIYTLMSGAERSLRAQQLHANNLANIETNGFRADLELATSEAVTAGYGYDTRHMSRLEANAVAAREGAVRQTGRELDVAIAGQGYFAVQWGDGEAYTRAGNFTVDRDGALTLNGRPVLGDGGPIVLPEHSAIGIGADGTISVLPAGQTQMQALDRLKLVRPAADAVTKNSAGLIVARSGETLAADDTVQVRSGHLEGSNVSAIEEMVATMNLNREFEIQMKLYRAADAMADAGNRLIRE